MSTSTAPTLPFVPSALVRQDLRVATFGFLLHRRENFTLVEAQARCRHLTGWAKTIADDVITARLAKAPERILDGKEIAAALYDAWSRLESGQHWR